jgi:N-acetyl-gamma-glutamyl-phosphate reductase
MIMHCNVNTIPVGVLGASGYAGRELCGLIADHPRLSLVFATANEQRGQTVRINRRTITFQGPDDAALGSAALVFSALPHGASRPWVARAREAGARVVDLSSDLRPGHGGGEAVYGMPELHAGTNGAPLRAAIRTAELVANPGCYPTSILLPLAPLLRAGVVAPGATVIANSASGVSGAGNTPRREYLFAEVSDDFRAYGVGNTHRHLTEMTATLAGLGADADLVFTPHLLPVARGILSTIAVPLTSRLDDPLAIYRDAYANEPFIEIASEQPALHDVVRRNVVRLTAAMIAGTRAPTLLVTAAIDNLVKGAAGQALQNANLMLGLEETLGLPA